MPEGKEIADLQGEKQIPFASESRIQGGRQALLSPGLSENAAQDFSDRQVLYFRMMLAIAINEEGGGQRMVVKRGGIGQCLYYSFQLVKVVQAVTISGRRGTPRKRQPSPGDLSTSSIIALNNISPKPPATQATACARSGRTQFGGILE